MGVVECLNHKLVEPFNVLYEKEGKDADVILTSYTAPSPKVKLFPTFVRLCIQG